MLTTTPLRFTLLFGSSISSEGKEWGLQQLKERLGRRWVIGGGGEGGGCGYRVHFVQPYSEVKQFRG